jgi:alpha-galactosidase/6-phospho-beta-glucosidase family protein
MKITIIGGGAHRVLGILRGALAVPHVLDAGKIYLYDLNGIRAEAMGRMLLKTPEQRRANCQIEWGDSLPAALEGADVVGMILPASSLRSFTGGHGTSYNHGFISSDNISPNGAMCGVKIAPVVMNVARAMEQYCPSAWLINFVNPVAVLSGMVNNHTRIRSLGVCAGFTNHLWDIPRLFGRDEEAETLKVEAAGINHLSYILGGTWNDRDLLSAVDEHLSKPWEMGELNPWWEDRTKMSIRNSVSQLVRFWNELGVLIFSTEGDGMAHLMYEEAVETCLKNYQAPSAADLERTLKEQAVARQEGDRSFQSWLDQDLDEKFWANHWTSDLRFKRQDKDIFVRIFSALAGICEAHIVTSRPNQGAIEGIKGRHVVEYSQRPFRDDIQPSSHFNIPDVVQGLTCAFAAHQTLLGDALATDDPALLAKALLAYPMRPYSAAVRSLYKDLFVLAGDEIRPPLRRALECL